MQTSKLIGYRLDRKYSYDTLKKELGEDLQEAINNEYFIEIKGNDEQPVYLFTEKGKQAAWEKK